MLLKSRKIKIIGITGGIASGKNFVSEIFRKKGAVIFDADAQIHQLLSHDKSVLAAIGKIFPQAIIDDKIDRKLLGNAVFSDQKKLRILENILHPILRKKYEIFLYQNLHQATKLLVLNIPLLLESNYYKCDHIISVVALPLMQQQRFLQRYSNANSLMSQSQLIARFNQIRSRQMSNDKRKKKSDFIVYSGLSKGWTYRQVKAILKKI